MKPNEVVKVKGGWRMRVLLPGEARRRTVPPTFATSMKAQQALDLWNSDVEGVEVPTCLHEIARSSCGLCAGEKADMSHAGPPANEHRGSGQKGEIEFDSRTKTFGVSTNQKIVDRVDWAERDKQAATK